MSGRRRVLHSSTQRKNESAAGSASHGGSAPNDATAQLGGVRVVDCGFDNWQLSAYHFSQQNLRHSCDMTGDKLTTWLVTS